MFDPKFKPELFITSIFSLLPLTDPARISLWPPKYFVALWITKSIPTSIGFWLIGLANVLSITEIRRLLFAKSEIEDKSTMFNNGLLGD